MRISLEDHESEFLIRAYAPGQVTVNEHVVRRSVIVTPDALVQDRLPAEFEAATAADFERLLEFAPEIILIGTGARQSLPAHEHVRPLLERGVGIEIMDTAAACRTYNILAADARKVLAALWMI